MSNSDELRKTWYAWEAAVKLCREDAEERRQEAFDLQREAETLRRHGHATGFPPPADYISLDELTDL